MRFDVSFYARFDVRFDALQAERDKLEVALRHLEQRLKSPTPGRSERPHSPREMTYDEKIQVSEM